MAASLGVIVGVGCAAPGGGEIDEVPSGTGGTEVDARCGDRAPADATATELEIHAAGDATLGLSLLAELGDKEPNVLLSPYSLRMAFGQVMAGAEGQSHDQIARVFGFEALGDARSHAVLNHLSLDLLNANREATEETPALLVQPINRAFLDRTYENDVQDPWIGIVGAFYGTCVEVFDMNADQQFTLDHVNGWVADQTRGRIDNLVKYLPDFVALIVVNALDFSASWAVPFEESLTAPGRFTTLAGDEVEVDMMRARALASDYVEGEGWQAFALGYDGGQFDMVVVVPDLGTQPQFEASLAAEPLLELLAGLEPATIDVRLPKFDLKSASKLRRPLERMGMTAPFSLGEFGGLATGMAPIYEVFHDVAIDIHENGTDASAATAVVFGEDGGAELTPEHTLVVDRVFYVVIRHRNSGALLFFARIGDPSRASQ